MARGLKRTSYVGKTKVLIRFAVTVQLISAFVFSTQIVQSLCFLNLKFKAFNDPLWLYKSDLVGKSEDRFLSDTTKYNKSHVLLMKKQPKIDSIFLIHLLNRELKGSYLKLLFEVLDNLKKEQSDQGFYCLIFHLHQLKESHHATTS